MRAGAVRPKPLSIDHFRAWANLLTLDNGEQWEPEDFQLEIVGEILDGARETLVLIPQGNGKTTTLAGVALYHSLYTQDARVPIGASAKEQAAILYDQAGGFIRRSPVLRRRFKPQDGYRKIICLPTDGLIKVYSADADTGDGIIPTLALVDEIHRHKDLSLYNTWQGKLGKRGGQIVGISTAGEDGENPVEKLRKRARECPSITRTDAHTVARNGSDFVMLEWALEETDDLEDLALVKTANPFSGVTLNELRVRRNSAGFQPWAWARLTCNVPMQGEHSAISSLDWAGCGLDGFDLPDGADGVWLGVDLGWKWDTTAIVPIRVVDGLVEVGVPVVVVPPRDGTSTREEDILDPIDDFAERFKLAGVVLDPNAGGEQLAQRLEAKGLRVITHSQDPAPMSLASERLATAVREKSLRHPNDPTLTQHVLAAEAKVVSGEKWRLVRPRRGGRVIDAAVALAMVISVAQAQRKKAKPRFEVIG